MSGNTKPNVLANGFSRAAKRPAIRHRMTAPVSLRLTKRERDELEAMAAGQTLSGYVRGVLFSEQDKRRKTRPRSVVADKASIAAILGLLGQARIANNLNQLAYQANVGSLLIDERERVQIEETYQYIREIRALLLQALK